VWVHSPHFSDLQLPLGSAKVQQWHLALMAKVSGAMDKGRKPTAGATDIHRAHDIK